MKLPTAAVLLVLGAASVAIGVTLQVPDTAPTASTAQPVFPGLAAKLASASRVELHSGANTSTLLLKDGKWGLAERSMYPVPVANIRALFAGLGELKQIEARTDDAASLARLGVDDPIAPGSTATSLRVLDDHGAVLASLILGHRSTATRGGLPDHIYIRRPNETRVWLAEGHLAVQADPQAWLARDIINIPRARVAQVTVQHGADVLNFTRAGDTMNLANPPPGKLDDYRVGAMASALEDVTLADVSKGLLPGTTLGNAAFTTTDGLTVLVTVNLDGKTVWASFAAHGTGDAAYAGLAGWAFQLPEWRGASLVPAPSDMIAKPPEDAPK
jgi:hypothetical protein